jgi:hypothetical protein
MKPRHPEACRARRESTVAASCDHWGRSDRPTIAHVREGREHDADRGNPGEEECVRRSVA